MPTYIAYARYSTNTTPITIALHYTTDRDAPWNTVTYDAFPDADLNFVDPATLPPHIDEDLDFHAHGAWLTYNSMGTLLGEIVVQYRRDRTRNDESRWRDHPSGLWAGWYERYGHDHDGMVDDCAPPPHPRYRRWRGRHED